MASGAQMLVYRVNAQLPLSGSGSGSHAHFYNLTITRVLPESQDFLGVKGDISVCHHIKVRVPNPQTTT
jgi:hypothetical protein